MIETESATFEYNLHSLDIIRGIANVCLNLLKKKNHHLTSGKDVQFIK